MPLAGVVGRADIMDNVLPGGLGGTFGGNPVSCAASIAVFDEVESHNLIAHAKRVETRLGDGLRALATKYPVIGDVRGKGAMLAIELVEPGTKKPNPAAVSALIAFGAQHGLLLLSAGSSYNVLRFLPAVTMSDDLIDDALSVLDEGFASL
jgi:4-aminobutyrate aminotransferase/(S)-3-amino-2-methylpropionate transaminase